MNIESRDSLMTIKNAEEYRTAQELIRTCQREKITDRTGRCDRIMIEIMNAMQIYKNIQR